MSHGGNLRVLAEASGKQIEEIIDFSANINPLGPPLWLRPLISSRIGSLVHYPDPDCTELLESAAERYGVSTDEMFCDVHSDKYAFARNDFPTRNAVSNPD